MKISGRYKQIKLKNSGYNVKQNFEEYLWANNDQITMMAIEDAYSKRKTLGDAIHRKSMQKFRTYMVVGGMPQAVHAFVEGKSYKEIDFLKRNILDLYEADLTKLSKNSPILYRWRDELQEIKRTLVPVWAV